MAPPSTSLLSQSEMDYIRGGCRENCRGDGRTCTEYRTYTILTGGGCGGDTSSNGDSSVSSAGPLILSNGSSRLICDDTQLLCSIKADVVRPSLHRPDEGVVELNVDHQLSTNSTKKRRQEEDELQELLHSLLLDHVVNRKQLCILPHYYVWRLYIDLYIVSSSSSSSAGFSGFLLDAASLAIRAALQHTSLPSVNVAEKEQQQQQPSTGTSTLGLLSSSLPSDATADLLVDGDVKASKIPPGVAEAPQIVTVTILKCTSSSSSFDPSTTTTAAAGGATTQQSFVLILDATAEEEACSYAQVHVTVSLFARNDDHDSSTSSSTTSGGTICAIQTSGNGSIPLSLLPELGKTALEAAKAQQAACHVVAAQRTASLLQEAFVLQ